MTCRARRRQYFLLGFFGESDFLECHVAVAEVENETQARVKPKERLEFKFLSAGDIGYRSPASLWKVGGQVVRSLEV